MPPNPCEAMASSELWESVGGARATRSHIKATKVSCRCGGTCCDQDPSASSSTTGGSHLGPTAVKPVAVVDLDTQTSEENPTQLDSRPSETRSWLLDEQAGQWLDVYSIDGGSGGQRQS